MARIGDRRAQLTQKVTRPIFAVLTDALPDQRAPPVTRRISMTRLQDRRERSGIRKTASRHSAAQ
jgi:hypothetical protein